MYPGEYSVYAWEGCMFCCCWMECSMYVSVRSIWSVVLFRSVLPYWFLSGWSIYCWKMGHWSLLLLLSTSPFSSVDICFMYIVALKLGAYIFQLYLLDELTSLYNIMIFVSCNIFDLKSILSDVSIAISALCGWHLHGISFPITSLSVCAYL